jgi:hypothetical protein
MEIKFLKAGNGDAILIHHNSKNILVDGGNDSRYLLEQINLIHQNEQIIDLLIITHHDDDHIKGIIDFLKLVNEGEYGDKTKFIKQVIFNSPRLYLGKIQPLKDRLLSYKQAHEAEELLLSINPIWKTFTDQSEPIIIDGLKIDFLSPTIEDIKEYSENKGAYLSSDYKCDWNSSMHILDKYIDDKSQDTSLFNKSSVVFKLEFNNKKVLLTGDVTPRRLEEIITKLVNNNNGNPIEFDFIKLPHHGSYRSINKKIIESIFCKNYIISTNSQKYFLPNKRALLKILKYSKREKSEKINFMFNYSEALLNLKITDKELKDYNFFLTSNNKQYGITI